MSGARPRLPLTWIILILLAPAMLLAFGVGFASQYLWTQWAAARPSSGTLVLDVAALHTATGTPTATAGATVTPTPTPTASATPTFTATPTPLPPTATATSAARGWLATLTLEDKIGQMIVAGMPSGSLNGESIQMLTQTRVGGVWFTRRNIQSVEQVTAFVTKLQTTAVESGSGVPLLIAIDHEGGDINRFDTDSGVTAFPSNMAVGAAGCVDWAWMVGQAAGMELRAMGINVNLAPVVDVNNNPYNPVINIRSYGADPEIVATCGEGYVAGLTAANVIAVAKHFPGHGNTTVDSHAGLPVISGSVEELTATELYPFAQIVNAHVPGVMVGHLLVPALDPNLPTSLSPAVVDGVLRTDLGFDGVVFTDDIARMGAISGSYTIGEAAVRAVQAGVDVLLMNAFYGSAQAVKDALLWAVNSGTLPEARIDASVERILRLKEQYGLVPGVVPTPGPAPDYTANAELADAVGLDAITWKPITANLLPLRGNVMLIAPQDRLEIVAEDDAVKTNLGRTLQQRGLAVTEFTYDSTIADQGSALWANIMAQAPGGDVVVMLTWDAGLALRASYRWQRDLVTALTDATPNVVVVALHTPYDLRALPDDVGTYLMTYGNTPGQVRGLADVLTGWQAALGIAPFPDAALGLEP